MITCICMYTTDNCKGIAYWDACILMKIVTIYQISNYAFLSCFSSVFMVLISFSHNNPTVLVCCLWLATNEFSVGVIVCVHSSCLKFNYYIDYVF